MFNSSEYPKSLNEAQFMAWLEKGRASRIPFAYLLIIWDELEQEYLPIYVEKRADLTSYEKYGTSPAQQVLVAAYDLYSESRVG
jgi:bifunctional DNase/RNase